MSSMTFPSSKHALNSVDSAHKTKNVNSVFNLTPSTTQRNTFSRTDRRKRTPHLEPIAVPASGEGGGTAAPPAKGVAAVVNRVVCVQVDQHLLEVEKVPAQQRRRGVGTRGQ